ncbi:FKBP-type peptidyl-prolyl cis-trans isomerase [Sinomonas notoginsengisoli]|uniref:FKBP-type peptidyl-prolyl cis-trans isomerase n=1 Tax=Sinomonas notoginsengisoli TaxID=1457311 RepID=UPI001F437317|nr:FKBP-type peptidyl-prolyl cis-trans isomerase [Sinomonas notoginsengisoli]
MRRLIALLLPLALFVAGCASSPSSSSPTPSNAGQVAALDQLKVTPGDKAPAVDFPKPLSVKDETIKMVEPGSGDQVKAGQTVEIGYVALNGADGSVLEDTFSKGTSEKVELSDELKQGSAAVYNGFVGAKVGSYLAYATPAQGTGKSSEAAASTLLVIKVLSTKDTPSPLAKPEGDAVTNLPAGLPKVTVDDKGVPQIDVKGADKPKDVVAQDLITGHGDKVKEADTIVANYVGVNLSDGTKFDSSFDRGQPATFSLQGVIPGWTKGLAGKTVGSRVLLVIPAAQAYGDQGQGKAKGDLVFVVDILGIK